MECSYHTLSDIRGIIVRKTKNLLVASGETLTNTRIYTIHEGGIIGRIKTKDSKLQGNSVSQCCT